MSTWYVNQETEGAGNPYFHSAVKKVLDAS
jgi:hypothetical protein